MMMSSFCCTWQKPNYFSRYRLCCLLDQGCNLAAGFKSDIIDLPVACLLHSFDSLSFYLLRKLYSWEEELM